MYFGVKVAKFYPIMSLKTPVTPPLDKKTNLLTYLTH